MIRWSGLRCALNATVRRPRRSPVYRRLLADNLLEFLIMLIRRSNLMVPITNPRFVSRAWRHHADAITLDLEDSVVDTRKTEARALVKEAIGQVGQGSSRSLCTRQQTLCAGRH